MTSATPCGLADAYLAGALAAPAEAAFLAHLATCATCQAELDDAVHLGVVEAEARRKTTMSGAATRPRRHRRWLLIAPTFAAAASIAALAWPAPPKGAPSAASAKSLVLALAPRRSLEARLTWPDADQPRPYHVGRGGAAAATGDHAPTPTPELEPISPATIIALEHTGDFVGVAAAWALLGDPRRAASALGRAGDTPDTRSDRAALALISGDAEAALALADAALAEKPDHVQAHWNRGLARRDLGAPLAAAEDFAAVAAADPNWRSEARSRAASLSAERDARRRAWTAMTDAGFAMLEGGAVLDSDTAHRFPGSARRFFYDAVRVAPDRHRLAALEPLARTLDQIYSETSLTAAIDRAVRRGVYPGPELAAGYVRLARGLATPAEAAAVTSAAGAAHLVELRVGALVLRDRAASDPDVAHFVKTAADPWFELLAADATARAALERGETAKAEVIWRAARERCAGDLVRHDYRCAKIDVGLADLYRRAHRTPAARDAAERGRVRAAAAGEWNLESQAQLARAELEFFAERWALARSLVREVELADSACTTSRWARFALAQIYIFERRPDEAAQAAGAAPRCGDAHAKNPELQALVDLDRFGAPALDRAQVAEAISARRATTSTPLDHLFLDYVEARLHIDRDPAGARPTLLEVVRRARALERTSGEGLAATISRLATTTLASDAARRGAHAELLADLGAPPGAECVVGVVIDDDRIGVAVRPRGRGVVGRFFRTRTVRFAELLGAALVAPLAECPTISVYATSLAIGHADLLPPELPWAYRLGRGAKVAPAAPADARTGERRVVVSAPEPPAALNLPALIPATPLVTPDTLWLRGAEATPGRVLAALGDATEIEIHAHGLTDLGRSGSPLVALSAGSDGDFALTAEALVEHPLGRRPVVVLADCGVAALSAHEAWGLPTAFLAAGASAVVASAHVIADDQAGPFFAQVLARVRAGEPPAAALAVERRAWLARAPWVGQVMLFE
jgi:hypothetical protein